MEAGAAEQHEYVRIVNDPHGLTPTLPARLPASLTTTHSA